MFELLNAIGRQINEETMANGGVLALCWEELNEVTRKESLYKDCFPSLEKELLALDLKERMTTVFAEAGLCLEAYNLTGPEADSVCEVLVKYLTEEDMELVEWDVCDSNGRMIW